MSEYDVRETFLRLAEHSRETSTLPADLVNGLGRLLARSDRGHLFVPVRSMQYLAIVDRDEIVFVDGQSGYAHRDGVGGRLIQLAWRPQPIGQRTRLDGPIPCDILYYGPALERIHRRLVGALRPIVAQTLGHGRPPPSGGAEIIALRR